MATEDCVRHTMDCPSSSLCPLSDSCVRVFTKRRNGNFDSQEHLPADVLFILDHSNLKDVYSWKAFSGIDGNIIDKLVERIAPDKDVAFTYLVRGWPVDRNTLPYHIQNKKITAKIDKKELARTKTLSFSEMKNKKKILDFCKVYLYRDIEYLKPKLIVAMGTSVKDFLFPSEKLQHLVNKLQIIPYKPPQR